jgi:hypothetical protein
VESSPFARAISADGTVVRGQTPGFTGPVLGTPQPVTTFYQTPTYVNPATPGATDPTFGTTVPGGVAPYTSDPWLNGGMMSPYGYGGNAYPGTAPGSYAIGLNGAQPYKFGWTERADVGWIAPASTNLPGDSELSVFETNYEKELTVPVFGNWIFSAAGQYNLRLFDGPFAQEVGVGDAFPVPGGTLGAAPDLPGNAHRFGLGLTLRTPALGPWTFEGGFNPSLATDFSSSLNSDAVLYDGHLVAYLRPNPVWTFAIGAAYWDRVDDIVIPYAGVVITPNEYLELRLLFPKPRISLFMGTPFGLPTWAYVQGEYHVEAYQVGIEGPRATDLNANGIVDPGELVAMDTERVQLEDWRIVGGFYTEGPAWTAFIEAGAAIEREVKYSGGVRGFDVDPGFLLRMGLRY